MKKLSFKYEELNASQFVEAVKISQETCILPFGVLEKHGPHLPLGTDLINVRELVFLAVKKEYTVVYPEYYFGQIFEAKHQPGTIAYSHEVIWNLLQETCNELARNGFKKIIIVNGHGGNNNFLKYFCQAQLQEKKDYIIHLFLPAIDTTTTKEMQKLRKTDFDGHAGEVETSVMLTHRPDLVQSKTTAKQSGKDKNRLKHIKHNFSGIWWYAKFPNHYAGDASHISTAIGELELKGKSDQLIEMIRSVKADETALKLQDQFFEQSKNPLNTKQ
jgi:creatinine amidohydrolase